ncbi:phosphatidylinositol 3- and 4-kinase [Ancylostoma ceylanicum]|uniref:Phosphatidylinositol 4-kinase beta n=1 Tax=Ancylostoma ceylanicum TaxID=53326 RepID=A0A0D6M344_9BILA|nr:phosphatidylinositol 3- and 4-kinase [Ancylostoma ceylanicum]
MDSFSLSPDCQHSATGLCSKCTLNQTFSISKAEERHQRNLSNGSAKLSNSIPNPPASMHHVYLAPDEFVSFPKLPVQTLQLQEDSLQPQADEVRLANHKWSKRYSKELQMTSSWHKDWEIPHADEVEIPREKQNETPDEDVHVDKNCDAISTTCPLVEPPSLLMRLFESAHFTPAIAVKYLFSCSEKGAKQYLGKKLFAFHAADMDFFVPQLISLYINDKEVASAIHLYIEERCKQSLHFALICVWLLESLGVDRLRIKDRAFAHGDILRRMILNEFKPPKPIDSLKKYTCLNDRPGCLSNGSLYRTLDSGCRCFEDDDVTDCICGASAMNVQKDFVSWLVRIGDNLREEPTKGEKTRRLVSELLVLNMHLPARVWIPLCEGHIVLNIPPTNSCVLNSKDKHSVDVGIDATESPWDTVSVDSCASEPVLRGSSGISHRLRQWVKRPGRRRQMRAHPDDPSASTMSEPWDEKKERIRQASPYGRLPGWDLLPVIVKSGDDLMQELLAYQLLVTLKEIWEEEEVPLYLRPYKIVVTSPDSGMIEPILDACSLHQIKRNQSAVYREEGKSEEPSLEAHFIDSFGPKGSSSYLQHNGNILIDADGHLIHIDFGFILSISPRNLGFETSPFKLTSELIGVMGGIDSDLYFYYKTLLLRGIIAARKHHERVMTIVQIMSKGSQLPCFRGGAAMLRALKGRFHMTYTDIELQKLVDSLVEQSRDSLTTRLYDNFQYYTNELIMEGMLMNMIVDEHRVVTAVTISRKLDIMADEANRAMAEFYEKYKGQNDIWASFVVTGSCEKFGVSVLSTVVCREEDLERVKTQFKTVESVKLFSLQTVKIEDLNSLLAGDRLEDHKFFRTDADRTVMRSRLVQQCSEELSEMLQSGNSDVLLAMKHLLVSPSGMKSPPRHNSGPSPKKNEPQQQQKMDNLFKKACQRQKTPKNTPVKEARKSPWSNKKDTDDSNDAAMGDSADSLDGAPSQNTS